MAWPFHNPLRFLTRKAFGGANGTGEEFFIIPPIDGRSVRLVRCACLVQTGEKRKGSEKNQKKTSPSFLLLHFSVCFCIADTEMVPPSIICVGGYWGGVKGKKREHGRGRGKSLSACFPHQLHSVAIYTSPASSSQT